MKIVIVKVKNKHLSEAFQKWCFENGFKWVFGEKQTIDTGNLNLSVNYSKTMSLSEDKSIYELPKQWGEATAAILEMIKPKEKKWTDDDMIRFAKWCDNSEHAAFDWYRGELEKFK